MTNAALDLEAFGTADFIRDRLNDECICLSDAMDFSAAGNDWRVVVHKVRFLSVILGSGNSVRIDYEYDWSLYLGCRDINDSGTEEASIFGAYEDGKLLFPVIPRSTDRSTDDEF